MAWFKQMTFIKTNETGGESVPTPEPDFTLPDGPFVARFEVHEQDNENLPLVKGWQMDGDKISAGFFNEVISEPDDIQMPDLSYADPGISYDTGGPMYTAEELQQMIADKKQQIMPSGTLCQMYGEFSPPVNHTPISLNASTMTLAFAR